MSVHAKRHATRQFRMFARTHCGGSRAKRGRIESGFEGLVDRVDAVWTHTRKMPVSVRGSRVIVATIIAVAATACTPSGRPAARSSEHTTTGPTHQSSPTPDYRAEVIRKLHLPVLGPGQACPTSGGTAISNSYFRGVAQGSGPVHPLAGNTRGVADLISRTQHPGWLAIKDIWFSEPRYRGPFLIRVRRLDGLGPAGLLENPRTTSFLVPPDPTIDATDGYREHAGATWVRRPGCVAWQVDGLTFSTVIVMRLICRSSLCTTPRHRIRPDRAPR
jgi:hypothetical protein